MNLWSRRAALACLALITASCSAGNAPSTAPTPVAPSPQPEYRWPLTATVTLTPDGPEPASVTINRGGRVTFINNDVRAHEMLSDPDLKHDDCPAINRVGFLAPGQRGESGVFEVVGSCGFHDHLEPTRFRGRIDVRIE